MGRRPLPARLWLRRTPKPARWLILDNVEGERRQVDTGCGQADVAGAQGRLREYLDERDRDGDAKARALAAREAARKSRAPHEVTFAELALWALKVKSPKMARPKEYDSRWEVFLDYVEEETLDCLIDEDWLSEFVAHCVKASSARRILEDVRAAGREWVELRRLTYMPPVPMPDKSEPRPDYLTRREVRALISTALTYQERQQRLHGPVPKNPGDTPRYLAEAVSDRRPWRHLVPYIVVSVMTCTRASRVYEASYAHEDGRPWIDLQGQRYHRLADGETESRNKRAPTVPLPDALVRMMRRWSSGPAGTGSLRMGAKYLVQYGGKPADCRKAFSKCVIETMKRHPELFKRENGKTKQVVRHTLRHTGVTLMAQAGIPSDDICDYAGMSKEVFERIYKHIDPEHMGRVMDAMGGRKGKAKPRKGQAG